MKINFKFKIVNQRHKRILFSYYDTSRQLEFQKIYSLTEAKKEIEILTKYNQFEIKIVIKTLIKGIKELERVLDIKSNTDSVYNHLKSTGGI